jgi:hypothetical protein
MPRKIENTTKAHLISVPLPQHGATYTVISHQFVMDYAVQQLQTAGFTISDAQYRCTADGQIAQGIYRLSYNQDPELSMMFAWTNSYNKQVKFKCVVGAYINNTGSVMVSGDIGNWVRKHTGTADTETKDTIDDYITNAHMYYNQLLSDKKVMESIDLNRRKQSQLLGVLFAEYEILTTEQASMVRDQMKKPLHVFASSDSLWAFYNYVTVALQKSHPRTWMEDQRILHFFISTIGKFETIAQPQVSQPVTTPVIENNTNEDTEEFVDPNQTSILDQIDSTDVEETPIVKAKDTEPFPLEEATEEDVTSDNDDNWDLENPVYDEDQIAERIREDKAREQEATEVVVEEVTAGADFDADVEMQEIKTEEVIKEKITEDEVIDEIFVKDDFSLDFNEETDSDQDNVPDFF